MKVCLAADFGSTFTKLTAIDLESAKLVGYAKSFTTIETNVAEGYENALRQLYQQCGKVEFFCKVASSSAAGGLKMVSSGLVPDLTAKASKLAAASAGAKVLKTYSYELTKKEQQEIAAINPDIILLSGGIDGGNKEVVLHNAGMIGEIAGDFAVIVAGNRSAADEVTDILKRSGKRFIICNNVMPEFNKLDIQPARQAIRELFIENIISAKGLDEVQRFLSAEIIPTPLAVYEAAELLARGTAEQQGLGELMAFDVGGATTDVYSMAGGLPSRPNVYLQGLNEPFAKRTVEGDIGVRYSIVPLAEAAGTAVLADLAGTDEATVERWLQTCRENPGIVPDKDSVEKKIDEALAAEAVRISAERHCGYTERSFSPVGEVLLQTGKDLTGVGYIIGSGGSVVNSTNPAGILKNAVYSPADLNALKPLSPKFLLDEKNCFAALGLISRIDKNAALKIMKQALKIVC